jgi:hypothetical protein
MLPEFALDRSDRAEWENLSLGYTPVRGTPALRTARRRLD